MVERGQGGPGRGAATQRRERVRALMREDIVAAARRLLDEHGAKGLAMRTLGKEVGVTAPTLYEYFPSKDAVLDALFAEGVDRLTAAFADLPEGDTPGAERLLALGHAYRAFGLANHDLYLLIFGRMDSTYRPSHDLKLRIKELFETVKREMARATDGDPEGEEVVTVAQGLWAMAHGFVTLEISGLMEDCSPGVRDHLYETNLRRLLGPDVLMPLGAPPLAAD